MVIKEDGSKQLFDVEKIRIRINNLTDNLSTEHMMIESCIGKIVKYAHNGKFFT